MVNTVAVLACQAEMRPRLRFSPSAMHEKPRWAVFHGFHAWLFRTYPAVFTSEAVTVTKINTLALLVEIKGSDSALKPLMLASHMDVVPVENRTLDRWTYPPFDGKYDGEFIHGRGAKDDKS